MGVGELPIPARSASEGTALGGSRPLSQPMPVVLSLAGRVVSKARVTSSDHQKIRANEPNARTTDRRHEENESATPTNSTDTPGSSVIPTIPRERSQTRFQTQPSSGKEVSYAVTKRRPARTNPFSDPFQERQGPAFPRCKPGATPLVEREGTERTNPFGPGEEGPRSPRRPGFAAPIRWVRRPVRIVGIRVETESSCFG